LRKRRIEKESVNAKEFGVEPDSAPLAQVDHEIAVNRRAIESASFGIGSTEGDVEGASKLFIEHGMESELLKGVVAAERHFAEYTSARIGVEQMIESTLAALGLGGNDLPTFETESEIGDELRSVERREGNDKHALGFLFMGSGEDFAVG
jgi:hypothetical protein